MLEQKFHASNSKNKNVADNDFLILSKYVILMYQIVNLGKSQLSITSLPNIAGVKISCI